MVKDREKKVGGGFLRKMPPGALVDAAASAPAVSMTAHTYETLIALKPERLSEAEWTRRAGVSSSFFQDLKKKGTTPRADNLEKVLAAIGVTPAQFYAMDTNVLTEVRAASGTADVTRGFRGEDPLPLLPVRGTAMGGEYGEGDEQGIELTELHLTEVLDWVARPAALARDPSAYALTIIGDSMSPRFEPGETVAVLTLGTPSIGDDVIVQLRGNGNDGDHDDRVEKVLIKRLVRRTATHVELRQFNPELTFRVDNRRIAAMHKVKGIFVG